MPSIRLGRRRRRPHSCSGATRPRPCDLVPPPDAMPSLQNPRQRRRSRPCSGATRPRPCDHKEVVCLLLEKGADKSLGVFGVTPMEIAKRKGHKG